MFVGILVAYLTSFGAQSQSVAAGGEKPLRLGNFSVSLAVKDLAASRAFYEKLGFKSVMGDAAKHWLILQNDQSTIGLFQGGFEKNTLTYNPGWDRTASTLPEFDDVRDIQKALKQKGLAFTMSADESTSGPAGFGLVDPDRNPILIDQHVPSPKKK
jgi:catechol 2,3-dioxygenase-like lactoylglutathione lyase family enzyme